jgi:hypothetical protein
MRRACTLIWLLLWTLTAACLSEPELPDGGELDAGPVTPGVLGGGPDARVTLVPDIPEAENLFFTPDGRLFVSGGENVFEVTRDAAGRWSKTDLFDESCLVEGITYSNGFLYGVCSRTELATFADAYLLAGELTQHPRMEIIGRLDALGIPNGLASDARGALYTTYSGLGAIAKIVLSAPLRLERVEIWSRDELPAANGLRFVGGFAYFTALDLDGLSARFGRIPVRPDGTAGAAEFLAERALTVFDDLAAYGDGFLIADYVNGSVLSWKDGNVVAETPPATFMAPTAVALGRPPLFAPNQLLVTEKGIIFVTGEIDGDRLSLYEL